MENRGYYHQARNGRGRDERGGFHGRDERGGFRGRGERGGYRGRGERGGYRERGGRPPRRGAHFGQRDQGRIVNDRPFENPELRNNERNNERNQPRGGRGRHNGPATNREDVPPISYTRLKEMCDDDSLEASHIILQLSSDQSGFKRRLRQDMDGGMIQMLLKVIAKMCRGDNLPSSFSAVLTNIVKSNFPLQLVAFCFDLIKEKNPIRKAQVPIHVDNCLALLRACVEKIPTTSENEASMLFTNLTQVVVKLDIGLQKDIGQNMEEISAILKELEMRQNPSDDDKKTDPGQQLQGLHDQRPPNNFRSLSVFPLVVDINQTAQPYLRTNLVSGGYTDVNHYLDVQFRLLREDFVRPLREGIQYCFTAGGETNLKRKDQQNIKVYDNVTIEYPLPGRSGIQYCIHFNATKLQRIRWQTSRRLMYGNLVCLSADKFKDNFLFATISDRDPRNLELGYVCVEFVCNDGIVGAQIRQNLRDLIEEERRDALDDLEDNFLLGDDEEEEANVAAEHPPAEELGEVTGNSLVTMDHMRRKYYMVETEAYFEAYRHVLSGLQKIDVIPLERYIVKCEKQMRPPRYLRRTLKRTYDFKRILRKDEEGNPVCSTEVDITDAPNWPSAQDLKLNPSQVEALRTAVTNELSVIQGPPGTGKTHVGLVIMKLLLSNPELRKVPSPAEVGRAPTGAKPAQILVVCFTNHALDQFLEGVAKFLKNGIIRVGSRCKSQVLDQFTLNKVRRGRIYDSTTKFHRRTVYQLRNDLNRQKDFILSFTNVMDVSTRTIVKLTKLQQVIPTHLYDQLTESRLRGDESLLVWLGVSQPVHILYEKKYIVTETIKAMAQPLIEAGFEFGLVKAAMIATGQFNANLLVEWMIQHQHQANISQELPSPDVVHEFLDHLQIPFDYFALLEEGFHEIEIKCALVATNFMRPNLHYIHEWLKKHASEEQEEPQAEDDKSVDEITNELNEVELEDDDIAFLQEQRQVDSNDEDTDSTDGEGARRRRNAEAMKNIEKDLAAATYDQVHHGGWQLPPEERKRRKRRINEQIGRVDAMPKRQADEIRDLFQLDQNERWRLYRRWVQDLRQQLRQNIDNASAQYNRLAKVLTEAKNEEDFQILRTADVIGMTTTGAAKYRDIVHRLPAKVVIVEEAAEVLEAHIVTSLPKTTEHLILIGDHQQLKPSPTVYELARKYNLDVSLFERMIRNGIPCSKLVLQHRMRPRIADLIRPHIYENLQDHHSVQVYDDIVGVSKNVFFISHEHEEDNVADGKSKINRHEANFLVAFCQYLNQQGYSHEQITILTTYVGQLHVINRLLPANLRKVRVSAVDNFQGEENDIILLSLVRSNEEGKIGFLSIENRVCVALSRAKKGLYCIGNANLLKEKSALWRTILSKLHRDDMFGEKLPLQCKNHPDKVEMVATSKDFEKVPEGGCGAKCDARLPCGHVCTRSCHPDDGQHELFKCRKPCERKCENNHVCRLQCWKECSCEVLMMKTMPKCGHSQKMKCKMDPSKFTCRVPCQDVKPCGHKCIGICGQPCPTSCTKQVSVEPDCGHPAVKVDCCLSQKPPNRACTKPCDATLKCGHKCPGNCFTCNQGRLHMRCQKRCERVLFCGHLCQESCSAKCPPCKRNCETACQHSKCSKKCFETCVLCKEKCGARFPGNVKCPKLCSEPCDKLPSNEQCKKTLKCGHRCIGLVQDQCPTFCRICDKDTVTEIFFGNEAETNAQFVQLECKHIFNYIDLDKWMEQESTGSDDVSIQWKECPKCKTPIRKSNRYRHIINKQLMLINEVKEKINGTVEDIEATKRDLTAMIKRDETAHERLLLRALRRLRAVDTLRDEEDMELLKQEIKTAKTTNELSVIETQFRSLKILKDIRVVLQKVTTKEKILQLKTDLLKEIKFLRDWLFKKRAYFSEQEIEDFEGECKRLKHSVTFLNVFSLSSTFNEYGILSKSYTELLKKLNEARSILIDKPRRFDTIEADVVKLMEEIENLAPDFVPGLGITVDERDMIVKAMSFGKGHWNKCRNGHVYCIGDCGGASEAGVCPECKETIGGVGHALAAGNQLAPEMDGATRPAYDPLNFNIPEELLH